MERFDALQIRLGIDDGGSSADFLEQQRLIALALKDIRLRNQQLNKELKAVANDSTLDLKERVKRREELSREIATNGNQLRQLSKFQREANNAFDSVDDSIGAYAKLSAELRKLTTQVQNAKAAGEIVPPEQIKRLKELDKQLKGIDAGVGRYYRNVGNYRDALFGLGDFISGGLLTAGIQEIVSRIGGFFGDTLNKIKEFEAGTSQLSSITGIAGKGLEVLADSAVELSTKFGTSATDVLKAYQLLVSAAPQLKENSDAIAGVTEQAEILSKASGLTLPEAIGALTQSMNQYGLSADNAQSITDILATSQQEGTATVIQLNESLKNVGATANAAGLSFETTNALLQGLAKGSTTGAEAGTKLRNILITLAQTGRKDLNPAYTDVSKILETLSGEVTDLTSATELFGKQNANAALTLIKQRDTVDKLNGSLDQYGNALDQANTNTDNLTGLIQKTVGSFDALILSVDKGDGIISKFTKSLANSANNLLQFVQSINDGDFSSLGEAFAIGLDPAQRLVAQAGKLADQIAGAKTQADKLRLSVAANNKLIEAYTIEQGRAGDESERFGELQGKINNLIEVNRKAQTLLVGVYNDTGDAVKDAADKVEDAGEKTTKSTKKTAADVVLVEGSIAALRKEISELQKQQQTSTTGQFFASIQTQIDATKKKLEEITNIGAAIAAGVLNEDGTVNSIDQIAAPSVNTEDVDVSTTIRNALQVEETGIADSLAPKGELKEVGSRYDKLFEDIMKRRVDIARDAGEALIESTGQFLEEGDSLFKAFSKGLIDAALQSLEQYAAIAIAQATARAFANNPILGAFVGAAATAAIRLAVQQARNIVSSFGEGGQIPDGGGITDAPSHRQGGGIGIGPGGRIVNFEGKEIFINKRSAQDKKVYTVTGTPAQIASGINSINGYGKNFAPGAEMARGYAAPPRPMFVDDGSGGMKTTKDFYSTPASADEIGLAVATAMQGVSLKVDVGQMFNELERYKKQIGKKYNS